MSEIEAVERELDTFPDTGESNGHYDPVNDSNGAGDVLGDEVELTDHQIDEMVEEADDEEAEPEVPGEEELEGDLISIATEKAMQELFAIQDRLDAAVEDHAEKAEVAKTAKKRVESLQEDLSFATRRLREARMRSEPDPEKYPLLDGPKAEINAMFAKPGAIPPLPADDWDEFYRRRARDQRFDRLVPSLKKGTLKALAELGLDTVDQFGIKSRALGEAQADLTTLPGMTEKRLEEISEAIINLSVGWKAEWDAAQAPAPAEAVTDSPVEAPAEGEEGGEDA